MHFPTRSAASAAFVWLVLASASTPAPMAQGARGAARIAPDSAADLRQWDQRVDSMMRSRELRIRQRRDDLVLEGRNHERAEQFHQGVRVFGGDVTRQLQNGQVVS